MSAFDWIAREHPALVHLPIAASLLLPLPLALALHRPRWIPAARLLAWAAVAGGLASLASGLLWARSLDLIPPGGFLPGHPGLVSTHEGLALAGLAVGAVALALIECRRFRPALGAALVWTALWGAAGHLGGRMVFPPADAISQSHLSTELPWAT